LYGGIHTIAAHTGAQAAAVLVDGYIQSTWNITPPNVFAFEPSNVNEDTEAVDITSLT